jgi:hypothetical protein
LLSNQGSVIRFILLYPVLLMHLLQLLVFKRQLGLICIFAKKAFWGLL